MKMSRDALSGITMAAGGLAAITAAAMMLQQAGMDFAGSFTAVLVLSLTATVLSVYMGSPLVVTPSLSMTGYLVFIVAISHGLGWQAMLGISFLASALGAIVWQLGSQWLKKGVGAVFTWAVRIALAVFLIYLGLKMGRIIITSAWQVTMLGDSSDPLMYWSMAGVVLTAALVAAGWRWALLAGMLITGMISLAEGFWVIPQTPFFLPMGWDKVIGQFALPMNKMQDSTFAFVSILSMGVMLSAVHWSTVTAFAGQEGAARTVKLLFAAGVVGAILGTPPLVISPTMSVGKAKNRAGVFMAAAIFAAALFCEPILAAIADFPAMVVPVLVGTGVLLLLETLSFCPLADNEAERRAEMLAVTIMVLLLPLTGNFATALGSSVIGYVLSMSMAGKGRQVTGVIWLISGIFTLYYIYGSIF